LASGEPEVDVTTSEASTMVTQRVVPWMKLGRLVDEPMTAQEAAHQGGIDFTVSLRPAGFYDADTRGWTRVGNRRFVVRDDTNTPLGVASSGYPVLQYGDAFDFMNGVSPLFVAAGALKGGRQGFMVVRAPETITVLDGEDPHELFLVLRTSHDCSRAVEVSVMPLRHRCMNQLTLQSFAANVPHRWSVTHNSSMQQKLQEAQLALTRLGAYAKQFETLTHRFVELKVTEPRAREVLERVLPDKPRRDDQVDRIIQAWHSAPTVGFDGTGWGLINAVSEDFEWTRGGGNAESRFIGALQGSTFKTVNRVAGQLLSRVSA